MPKLTKEQKKLLPGRKLRNIAWLIFGVDIATAIIMGAQQVNIWNFWATGFGDWRGLHFVALAATIACWTVIIALWTKAKKQDIAYVADNQIAM